MWLPKRKWLRFSLGTFLLAVAVVAYGCKWVLDTVHLYAQQYYTVEALSPWIGNWQYPKGWRKTLADRLGVDYRADVFGVHLQGDRKNWEADVEGLNRLPLLDDLGFIKSKVTPDMVERIKDFRRLARLRFIETDVTEAIVEELRAALPHTEVIVEDKARF